MNQRTRRATIGITRVALADQLDPVIRALAEAIIQGRGQDARELRGVLAAALRDSELRDGPPMWPVFPITDLPASPGVYVITSNRTNEHYVGLALDLRDRFHNPTYGHLATTNKSRAGALVRSNDYTVRVPYIIDTTPADASALELSRLEIRTYVTLATTGEAVTNSLAMLGRVGETEGSPVVLCECATDAYVYTDSLAAAGRYVGSRAIMPLVYGHGRTARGYAARWATQSERELLAPLTEPRGVLVGPSVRAAVTQSPSDASWTGQGRNGDFRWTRGLLSEADRERLARYRRSAYTRREFPGYLAVDWSERNRAWVCRARTGFGLRDIWQVGHRRWTALDAAIAREEKIRAESWERFNTGRYSSNAQSINAALGADRFSPW
jgi:hypothetical protein